MTNLALPLALAAAATLTACGTPPQVTDNPPAQGTVFNTPATVVAGQPVLIAQGPVQPGTVIVPSNTIFKAGYGVVESVQTVRILPANSASAGSSGPERVAYRLTIRMQDGSYQAVDQDNRSFQAGDRVQIMADGRVMRQ